MRELEFIRYLAGQFSRKRTRRDTSLIKGIGDDCAIMRYTKDKHMLFTCDMIIEGTHFSKHAPPFQIGWKAMACNISDIASMGGIPRYALLSLGLPRNAGVRFLREVVRGIHAICGKFNISVIGGDTNGSQKIVLNVTLIGEVEKKLVVRRDGARAGDLIFVTGVLGAGKIKHLDFLPRLKEARCLVKNFRIHSMIDISDGLAMDLHRIAEASKVGARIHKSLIPLSDRSGTIDNAISQGEDYELLFTASLRESKKIMSRMGKKVDLPLTLIGEITTRRFGVKIVQENGAVRPLVPAGYRHI